MPTTNDQTSTVAIEATINAYVEGGRAGDASLMRGSFRSDAVIHGFMGPDLIAGPIQVLFDWVDENPPATDLSVTGVTVDLAGTVATARVELRDWLGHDFTDQFTLLEEDGTWKITAKVFHAH